MTFSLYFNKNVISYTMAAEIYSPKGVSEIM